MTSNPKLLSTELDEIHIWHCHVPDEWPDTSCLSEAELEKANRFVYPQDQRRYATTRRFVRELLSSYRPTAPENWRFITNDYGKPRINPEQCSDIFFNISHTKSSIVCAISSFPSIGADMEDRIPDDFSGLASRFFSPEELRWLEEATEVNDARDRFLALWTLKEAFIKAVGRGLSISLSTFAVIPTVDDSAELVRWDESEASAWCFRRFRLNNSPIALAFPQEYANLPCRLRPFPS